MVHSLARSISLVVVSTAAGLNVGMLSINGFTGHAARTPTAVEQETGERGGAKPWRAATAYLPSMSFISGLGFSGAYAIEESSSIRQTWRTQAPLNSDGTRGGRRRVFRGHDSSHREGVISSASMLRGGELEPERELPRGKPAAGTTGSLKLGDGAPLSTREKDFSARPRMWSHTLGSTVGADPEVAMDKDLRRNLTDGEFPTKAEETTTTFVSECLLPTKRGNFHLRAYKHYGRGRALEPVVMMAEGGLTDFEGVPVRVHDQCVTSEVLGSLRCDCKQQLEMALDYVKEHGGCVIYLQQEGRGIGLANKVAAYALQDGGLDTVDANRHLGFPDDLRSYEAVEHILADMGIKSIKLMTNNPYKLKSMRAMGVEVLSRIPMLAPPNAHSRAYLEAKAHRMSHLLHQVDDVEFMDDISDAGSSPPVSLSLDQFSSIRGGASSDEELDGEWEETQEEEDYAFGRDSVLAAIEAIREGKCVVVTDDEGRENEGDLVFAAEKATEDLLAFTIRTTSGVICASLEEDRLEELHLPQMVVNNEDPKATAFTITVDAKEGISTGISAGDRAHTLRMLADPESTAHEFNRPGHIFPLRYTSGGVLKRGGHTEAAVDLARLAGLKPVGVLCEITTKDGKGMARLPELREFCAEHGLVLTSIQDLRCLIRERQRAGVLAGADPSLSCIISR